MVQHRGQEKRTANAVRAAPQPGEGKVNDAEVQKYVEDLEFPCTRQELLNHVRGKGAPQKVLDFIGQFKSDEYGSRMDLSRDADRVKH